MSDWIRPQSKHHVVGEAFTNAELKTAKDGRPFCKLTVIVKAGKNKLYDPQRDDPKEKYLPSEFYNLTVFGDEAKDIRKGDSVELYARYSPGVYRDKQGKLKFTRDYIVMTNEQTKKPAIQFAGGSNQHQREHLSDEQIAHGKTSVESLEITDDDIPF